MENGSHFSRSPKATQTPFGDTLTKDDMVFTGVILTSCLISNTVVLRVLSTQAYSNVILRKPAASREDDEESLS
jgi:hypothetical protein